MKFNAVEHSHRIIKRILSLLNDEGFVDYIGVKL